ncbi:MAG: cellulose synthase subunit BcsC-related outer membrane protein, partial [Nevskia sp.]|nr:cellulose synthase subunit BcsC-related outer membrane protein [Nevskia sp.]
MWLRQALDRYTRDAAILALAARYEMARGDNQRAADYWRASLAVMPAVSPVDKLAHTLVYPGQDLRAHRAVTANDLHRLLDPDDEPFAKTTKVPALPAYGFDPYQGAAPVVPAEPVMQQAPSATGNNASSTSDVQPDNAPDSNPAVRAIPSTQPNPQMFHQQSAVRLVAGGAGTLADGGWTVHDGVYRTGGGLAQGPVTPLRLAYGGAGKMVMAQYSAAPAVPITANAPHSMASDAWKGLVFSLMAGNRNAEALQTLDKIPADVRRQLEADIEFVQGVASLYVAVGDSARAGEYLNRVDNYYVLHRAQAPAGLEIQHAWLLYNIKDDVGLYPVLSRLDGRADLTVDQRQQTETLWADWAVRRAVAAMDGGHLLRGVEILQAASLDYPDNMDVRRAVAGAYARVGRATDAVTLFKTIPMDSASSGDYQGAISAALGATDMAQAEAWLRQALARYPSDPQILGLAARFEQARGNNERAADFWRAALSAMPAGASMKSLDSGLVYPPGAYHSAAPGDTKRMLDPRRDPLPGSKLPPLPTYAPQSQAPVGLSGPPAATVPQRQWRETPSDNPLPMPAGGSTYAAPQPGSRQGTAASNAPIYIPQSRPQAARQAAAPAQPVFIEQSATQDLPSAQTAQNEKQEHPAARRKAASKAQSYTGTVHLPASEQTIDTAAPESAQDTGARDPELTKGLRISSQPMGTVAAQVQARFAEETDSQLTQGSALCVHTLANAAVSPQFGAPVNSTAPSSAAAPNSGQYSVAQYTPSAQEVVTGAYSVPRQQTTAEKPSATAPRSRPVASASTKHRKQAKRATHKTSQTAEATLGNTPALNPAPAAAPVELPPPPPNELSYEAQAQQQAPTGAGLSDQELQQRNLPPLRGPWVRIQRGANPVSPRDEAEMQLRSIESGYSAWLGGSGYINYRSGALGYDHLAALEAPFEVSMPLGYHGRFTIVAKPVFLDSGQADGSATIQVLQSTTGGNKLVTIPEPIGTLTGTDATPPAQQNAVGIGGEVQLAFAHAAIAGGYTPTGFLVSTFTARGVFKPGNGPITISVAREAVKDSQLSYAGLRDPAGNTLAHLGQIWGGVVANQGNVQFVHGDANSGFYLGAGGQYLTGYNVKNN